LKIKTYIFDDVKNGIETLKNEYGPDTIIIDIKENVKNGSRKSCEISVVIENGSQSDEYDPVRTIEKTEDIWNHTTKLIMKKIATLESEIIMERLKSYPLPLRFIYKKMIDNDFGAHLAMAIISEIYGKIGELANETVKVGFFLKNLLVEKIKTSEIINTEDSLILLGPKGAGKTQTAKKLAIMHSALGKPVTIVACESKNSEGSDELKIFAENAGIPFLSTFRTDELYSVLETDNRKKIIDISGCVAVQKEIVSKTKDIRKILLLTAGARDNKIHSCFNQFNDSNDVELIFTKLDEEEVLGHICYNLIMFGCPVCCFTTGSDIKDIVMPGRDLYYKIIFEGNKWIKEEEKPLQ